MKRVVLVSFIFCLLTSMHQPVQATPQATITVNTLTDDLLLNQNCSLREAILAVNDNVAVDACPAGSGSIQADVITFAVSGTILMSHPDGELQIEESVIIEGNGRALTTIDAQHGSRIFHITGGRATTVWAMTLQNGATGLYGSGAVRNIDYALYLDDVLIQNSLAAGIFVSGGGISSGGDLNITNSTIQNNSARLKLWNGDCNYL